MVFKQDERYTYKVREIGKEEVQDMEAMFLKN